MSLRAKALIIAVIILAVNAGLFFYTYNTATETGEVACEASAITSKEVQNIYRRNIGVTYPELYRAGSISGEGLNALTTNSVEAILRLEDVESKCLQAVDAELD